MSDYQDTTSRYRVEVLPWAEVKADGIAFREGPEDRTLPWGRILHALAACLTTSLVYVAAARGVHLTEVESRLEGEMDVRGCLGLDDDYRNGFTNVRVAFTVKGDAPDEKLREIVSRAQARSAVYDMVTHGVPVDVSVKTA